MRVNFKRNNDHESKQSFEVRLLEHDTNLRQILELSGYKSSKRNSEAGSSGYNIKSPLDELDVE